MITAILSGAAMIAALSVAHPQKPAPPVVRVGDFAHVGFTSLYPVGYRQCWPMYWDIVEVKSIPGHGQRMRCTLHPVPRPVWEPSQRKFSTGERCDADSIFLTERDFLLGEAMFQARRKAVAPAARDSMDTNARIAAFRKRTEGN